MAFFDDVKVLTAHSKLTFASRLIVQFSAP